MTNDIAQPKCQALLNTIHFILSYLCVNANSTVLRKKRKNVFCFVFWLFGWNNVPVMFLLF